MKNILIALFLMITFAITMGVVGAKLDITGATNFDYVVFGESNYGTDPNPGKDITFRLDNFLSNDTAGTLATDAGMILGGGFRYAARDTATVVNADEDASDTLVMPTNSSNIVVVGNTDGDTITWIRGGEENKLYILNAGTATLRFADGGNLKLTGLLALDNVTDRLMLVKFGANWIQLGFTNND